VLVDEVLVGELAAIDALASDARAVREVATLQYVGVRTRQERTTNLDHELGDDAVKG
jgi:hypothetical protein